MARKFQGLHKKVFFILIGHMISSQVTDGNPGHRQYAHILKLCVPKTKSKKSGEKNSRTVESKIKKQ